MAKPFLKWVGGKTQILEQVLQDFPTEIHNYHEPFVGGGSILLAVLSAANEGRIRITGTIFASDANANLISLFKHVQESPESLLTEVRKLTDTTEDTYYEIRKQFNAEEKGTLLSSAKMLFLNKTCFRGMYREGKKGFNVPFGHYTNPTIVEEDRIRYISSLLQGVVFTACSFEDSLARVQSGDYVYLDPPYVPVKDTSFVGYTSDGFCNHETLFALCKTLPAFLMSNADVPFVRESFPPPFKVKSIVCRRAIHAKKPGSKAVEVLITGNAN
jgi:DNA adenine methylase